LAVLELGYRGLLDEVAVDYRVLELRVVSNGRQGKRREVSTSSLVTDELRTLFNVSNGK
jgi:hypothetical protein